MGLFLFLYLFSLSCASSVKLKRRLPELLKLKDLGEHVEADGNIAQWIYKGRPWLPTEDHFFYTNDVKEDIPDGGEGDEAANDDVKGEGKPLAADKVCI